MVRFQKTIAQAISTTGISLHAGGRVRIELRPAPADHGIVFRRTDLMPNVDISVLATKIGDTRLASVLQNGQARVSTVEHLLSACAGLEIDNLLVEIDAEEIPIMDGSAASFIYLLQSAGVMEQSQPRQYIKVKKAIQVNEGDKWARLEPHHGFMLDFTIEFDHPAVSSTKRNYLFDLTSENYIRHIARARTFGFVHEVEGLRQMGLARGGSLDNAIVFDQYRMLNNEHLRFDDELVKHKILDAIGDLYLAGHQIHGRYTAFKSGHGINNKLVLAMLNDQSSYELITADGQVAKYQDKNDMLLPRGTLAKI